MSPRLASDDGHLGRDALDVLDQAFELVFGALRGGEAICGEGDGQVMRGVHDGGAEVKDFAGVALQAA